MKNGLDMNGIIIDGAVYEVADFGEKECNDCSLQSKCKVRLIDENPFCASFSGRRRKILRYSQFLTDKLNSNGFQQEDTSAGL